MRSLRKRNRIKVFWFFSSKKNCFLAALLTAGPVHAAHVEADWRIVSATLEDNNTAVQIIYRNGHVVTVRKTADEESFDAPEISQDKRSVGWSVEQRVASTFAITADADIYRDGHEIPPFECPGGVTVDWHFEAGGKLAVFEQEYPHGVRQRHWCLVDVASGTVRGRVSEDDDTGKPPPFAPAWAR